VTIVEAILAFGGGGVITAAGVKIFNVLFKHGGDVAKTALKERRIKEVHLSGSAQEDIAAVASWALNEFKAAQGEQVELQGKIASLETANNVLRSSFEKMKSERDIALAENKEFVKQISDLLVSSTNLTERLAKRESEYALLAIEHEGAKARIAKYEQTITEMKIFIDEMNAERARLESELERARTRG
jgi:chromosome segregation ATPase